LTKPPSFRSSYTTWQSDGRCATYQDWPGCPLRIYAEHENKTRFWVDLKRDDLGLPRRLERLVAGINDRHLFRLRDADNRAVVCHAY
jgi:hypothetical protein